MFSFISVASGTIIENRSALLTALASMNSLSMMEIYAVLLHEEKNHVTVIRFYKILLILLLQLVMRFTS